MRSLPFVGIALLAAAISVAQTPPASQTPPAPPLPRGLIVGAWTLNQELSDKPQDNRAGGRGQGGRGGGGRYGGGGGRGGGFGGGGRRGGGGGGGAGGGQAQNPEDQQRMRQAVRDILEAPGKMTITQTDSMVIITTGDGRTTRLSTDGKKVKDESTGIERKTHWQGESLVSEISGAGAGKITETYTINPESHQLSVTLAIAGNNNGTERPPVHRVYDLGSN